MDMFKEEASIHEPPSEMSTLNDECFTVMKSGAVVPTADNVLYISIPYNAASCPDRLWDHPAYYPLTSN
jgi:hypothetical protein